jgi:hypothetical protein
MLFRSPRRLVFLCFLASIFVFALLQQSPWVHEKVYERLPLFKSGHRPDLAWGSGLDSDRLKAHPQDAWQHAVPVAMPGAPDIALVEGGAETVPHMVPSAAPKPTESHPPWVTAPSRTGSIAPPTPRPTNIKQYMQSMLKWDRPSWDGHWPPFRDYINKKYDPNRWEQFDM